MNNMNHKFYVSMAVAISLGVASVARAQDAEVDADALINSLEEEISQIDERESKETPQALSAAPGEAGQTESQPKSRCKEASQSQARVVDESGALATKDSKVVVVTASGKGETKDEARKNAYRAAIEKAVGVYVDAESMMQNYEMVKDRVNTISNADIKECETLEEKPLESGGFSVKIKATVEKKAITPKFKDVFPAAFADVGGIASGLHAKKVTAATRSKDAAALMTAALGDVDRMKNWIRLSVVEGKELRPIKNNGKTRNEPGKSPYAIRYSLKFDKDAYFKGFVPHFKEVLSKMQLGAADEDVLLHASSLSQNDQQRIATLTHTIFANPVSLSGFPRASIKGGNPARGTGGNPSEFMFDANKGLAKVQDDRSYNIWLIDRMNKDMSAVRCSAYKVPDAALRAYWKIVYGDLDSSYVCKKAPNELGWKAFQKIEIVLLDKDGEEIAATTDVVPTAFLTGGFIPTARSDIRELWGKANTFDSFLIRPLFGFDGGYSSEIQREAGVFLSDAQLAEVKSVEVRFSKSLTFPKASNAGGAPDRRRQPRR